MSDKDNQAENQPQNSEGQPPKNALNYFGRAFYSQTKSYPPILPPQALPSKFIAVWERLETGENEPEQIWSSQKSLEGMVVKRLETKEPLDFLEYCRRSN